jgi:DNA-binding NarL/FixJ family response regulator
MKKIKVFIADDHKLFRAGVAELLKDEPDIDVLGQSSDGEDALKQIKSWPPDIVLMDIDFGPGKEDEGIVLTQELSEHFGDQLKIIMLTMHDEPAFLIKSFEAGAKGYILKESSPEKMISTIREVHSGGVILSPLQASKIIEQFQHLKQAKTSHELASLTEREKEILRSVGKGASNLEIASELNISEKTVRNRLSQIFSKLHVNNRTQAAQVAEKLGLDHSNP